MQQLNCCVEKRQTFLRTICSLQTAQISVLWIKRSGRSCKSWLLQTNPRRLINVWCSLEQLIFDKAIDQWRGRHRACVQDKEDILSTVCELTMLILSTSVILNVTCLTITSLITKLCQQRWPIHSCSFYKVVH